MCILKFNNTITFKQICILFFYMIILIVIMYLKCINSTYTIMKL